MRVCKLCEREIQRPRVETVVGDYGVVPYGARWAVVAHVKTLEHHEHYFDVETAQEAVRGGPVLSGKGIEDIMVFKPATWS